MKAVDLAKADVLRILTDDEQAMGPCVEIELLGFYVHWMDRHLFLRGGDEMRTEIGQPIVETVTQFLSTGEPSDVSRVFESVNEAGAFYHTAVQAAHRRTGVKPSGPALPSNDIPILTTAYVHRVAVCLGEESPQEWDPILMRILLRASIAADIGPCTNDAGVAWMEKRGT